MTPRPRSVDKLPKHIRKDAGKIPKGVYFNPDGNHWRYQWYEFGVKSSIWLCGKNATIDDILIAYAAIRSRIKTVSTFRNASLAFQESNDWRELSQNTRDNYKSCHKKICAYPTLKCDLGDVPLTSWTKPLVLNYRDKRSQAAKPGVVNFELNYLKKVFSWLYEYDRIEKNPTDGIRPLKVSKPGHLVDWREYDHFLITAKNHFPWQVWVVAEITLATRARLNEVLALTEANADDRGLLLNRLKGSRNVRYAWTPRLKAAWDFAVKKANESRRVQPMRKEQRYVILSHVTHDRIGDARFQKIWRDAMAKAEATATFEFRPFQHRALKPLAISSDMGDKNIGAGHKSRVMTDYYDLSEHDAESVI